MNPYYNLTFTMETFTDNFLSGTKYEENMMKIMQRMPIIDDETFLFILSISFGAVCQAITVFGIVSNIINLIVFVKQGFSDFINISLAALAVSDLCSLVTIMWTNLCFTPAFRDSGIPMVTTEVHLITGSWTHVVFTRITGFITAFISFERCICVILPLKVKTMFTRKRHIIAMVAIYMFTLSWASLAYVSVGVGWKFYQERNETLLGLINHMTEHKRYIVDAISFTVNGIIMPVTCFLSVVVFTCVLVWKLNQNASWRLSHSSVNGNNNTHSKAKNERSLTTRDQKVAKMVVLISSMFITCFIPTVCIFVARYVVPDLDYDGLYRNMFVVTLSVCVGAEGINSSVNIFIYLRMSTKYRDTFKKMFKLCGYSKTASQKNVDRNSHSRDNRYDVELGEDRA